MELKYNHTPKPSYSNIAKQRSKSSVQDVISLDSIFPHTYAKGRSQSSYNYNSIYIKTDMKSLLSRFQDLKSFLTSKPNSSFKSIRDIPSQLEVIEIELTQVDYDLRSLQIKNRTLEQTVEKLENKLKQKQEQAHDIKKQHNQMHYKSSSFDVQSSTELDLHKEGYQEMTIDQTSCNGKEFEYISLIKELQQLNAKLKTQLQGYELKQTPPNSKRVGQYNSSNSSGIMSSSLSPIRISPLKQARMGKQERYFPFLASVNKLWIDGLRSEHSLTSRSLEIPSPVKSDSQNKAKVGQSVARKIVEKSLKQQILREKLKRLER